MTPIWTARRQRGARRLALWLQTVGLLACASGDMSGGDPAGADSSLDPKDPPSGQDANASEAAPGDDAADAAPADDASDASSADDEAALAVLPDASDAGDASSPGTVSGVRCGAASAALGCEGATPVCCARSDAGAASYACETTGACSGGYPILCAAAADCEAGAACCRYNSAMKCEPSCPVANLVCDPADAAPCGSGHSCTVPVVVGGVTSAYFTCNP